jgi:hypothetical protein
MSLRPGQSVRILVHEDMDSGRIDVRSSLVYDVEGKAITLAQTDPPLLHRHLGKDLMITYVNKDREKGGAVRLGLRSRVTDLINDYKLSSGLTQGVILVALEGEPAAFNLRMYFRVEPPGDSGLTLTLGNKNLTILDISIGGVRFSHPNIRRFMFGELVEATLTIDGVESEVVVRVLRVWEESERRLEFVSAVFPRLDQRVKDLLGRKIMDIDRRLRFKEVFG